MQRQVDDVDSATPSAAKGPAWPAARSLAPALFARSPASRARTTSRRTAPEKRVDHAAPAPAALAPLPLPTQYVELACPTSLCRTRTFLRRPSRADKHTRAARAETYPCLQACKHLAPTQHTRKRNHAMLTTITLHSRTQTCTHAVPARPHAATRARMHARAYTRMHTHALVHVHTHAHSAPAPYRSLDRSP